MGWRDELRALRQLRFTLEREYHWTPDQAGACRLEEVAERLAHLRPRDGGQDAPSSDLEAELLRDLGGAEQRGARGLHPRIEELLKR